MMPPFPNWKKDTIKITRKFYQLKLGEFRARWVKSLPKKYAETPLPNGSCIREPVPYYP